MGLGTLKWDPHIPHILSTDGRLYQPDNGRSHGKDNGQNMEAGLM